MEELQSTEVLEREILEDARKKALRILKTADDTLNEKISEWENKTTDTINTLEANYNEQRKLLEEKIMARLPIDKLRVKVNKIESLLKEAVNDWYKQTSRDRIVELLTDELSKRLDILKGIRSVSKMKATYSNMDIEEVKAVFKNSNIDIQDIQEIKSGNPYPVITIDTDNTRIIASIQEKINFLLSKKREELVEALVGRDFMENV